jgi:amidase
MARTPGDLANLLGILLNDADLPVRTATDTWEGQRVGFVDPTLWGFAPFICNPDAVLIDQQRHGLVHAANTISEEGGIVEQPVPLISMDKLVLAGEDALEQLWSMNQ